MSETDIPQEGGLQIPQEEKKVYPHKPFEALKEALKKTGPGVMVRMRVLVGEADKDGSKSISQLELIRIVGHVCPSFNLGDMLKVAEYLASNGTINYESFLKKLRPAVSDARMEYLNKLYNTLDANGNGVIEREDMKLLRQGTGNVKYTNEHKVLTSFLRRLGGPTVVTRDNFFDYYSVVSQKMPNDTHFFFTMKKHWKLPE